MNPRSKQIITTTLSTLILAAGPAFAKDKDVTTGASPEMVLMDVEICDGFNADVDEMVCVCPSDFSGGSVWGSGPYTGDSNICTAALHAGLIGSDDSYIHVSSTGAQDGYLSTTQNEVTTSRWGSYGTSFTLAAADTSGMMVEASEPMLPTCEKMPADAVNFNCSCPADGVNVTIWGNDPYTADSDICTAARHAGVIRDGGNVTVLRLQGLVSYIGAEVNGISTSDWGRYDSSITFDWNPVGR